MEFNNLFMHQQFVKLLCESSFNFNYYFLSEIYSFEKKKKKLKPVQENSCKILNGSFQNINF